MKSSLADWKIEDEIVYFKERCYLSKDKQLQRTVVSLYYDTKSKGHPGILSTVLAIRQEY